MVGVWVVGTDMGALLVKGTGRGGVRDGAGAVGGLSWSEWERMGGDGMGVGSVCCVLEGG